LAACYNSGAKLFPLCHMPSPDIEPSKKEARIRPETGRTLQTQLETAIRNGVQRIYLEGHFSPDPYNNFSLIRLKAHHNLELIGDENTIIDGKGVVNHIIFLDNDARLTIRNLTITGGSTAELPGKSQAPEYQLQNLNLFRHLDGGAVSVGGGAIFRAEGCRFIHNYSALCGGAVSNLGGWGDFQGCDFIHNHAYDTGAAIDNLARGSLTTIQDCTFANNQANRAGGGTYGAVTVFPGAFLFVAGSYFMREQGSAIDYKTWKNKPPSHVFIAEDNIFLKGRLAIMENPISNRGVARRMISRFIRLQALGRKVKFEGIPSAPLDRIDQHEDIYRKLVKAHQKSS